MKTRNFHKMFLKTLKTSCWIISYSRKSKPQVTVSRRDLGSQELLSLVPLALRMGNPLLDVQVEKGKKKSIMSQNVQILNVFQTWQYQGPSVFVLYIRFCKWYQEKGLGVPFPQREEERNCLTSNNDIIPQLQNPNSPLAVTTLGLSSFPLLQDVPLVRKWK